MVIIKQLYYGIASVVKGICDKTYYQDRPSSVDERLGSYLVISFPSAIVNNELSPDGSYNDYTTTVLLEVYVRDKMCASNPTGIDLAAMETKLSALLKSFPIDDKHFYVTRPELVMQSNDNSGFHVAVIRAKLRTK